MRQIKLGHRLRGTFAICFFTITNWRLVKTLMIYRIPQAFLPHSRLCRYLPYFFWPLALQRTKELNLNQRIILAADHLGPVFVKFGQIISTRVDILPTPVANALEQLQDRVTPFPWHQAETMIRANLGSPVHKAFKKIQKKSIGSASLAQVHTATLNNNRKVIIKLLRPNIHQKVKKNLKTLYQFASLIDRFHPNGRIIRATEVISDYDRSLHNEMDLRIEAANCSQMYRHSLKRAHVKIPRVMWKYCFKNMLVTEFIDGIPVTDSQALQNQGIDKKRTAERILMLFLDQTFKDNFFHADMHPGNILIRNTDKDSPEVQLVDFGIVGSLTREDQLYIGKNLLAFFVRDYEKIIQLHIESGWIPPINNQQNMMNQVRAIGEPLYARPLKDISFAQVLGDLIHIARQYQMVVQPQLILLQKTIFNIEALARRLDPQMNLWENAKPYVEKWIQEQYSLQNNLSAILNRIPDTLYQFNSRQQSPAAPLSLPNPSRSHQSCSHLQYLLLGFAVGILTMIALYR